MKLPEDTLRGIRKILNTYGLEPQLDKFIEEVGEALSELGKLRITGESIHKIGLIQELADVQVMIIQIVLGLDAVGLFDSTINNKVERQIKRINKGE